MFAGHLAAGMVLKKMERRINLGWLFFAALAHDSLLGIFTLLGLKQIHAEDYAQTHYLTFTYSHGLAASVVWSLLTFGITYAVLPRWKSKERTQASVAMGLAVFSHFVLDWLVHIPEMPLLGNDSPMLGLGLRNNLPLALTLEVALVVIGFVSYLIRRQTANQSRALRLGRSAPLHRNHDRDGHVVRADSASRNGHGNVVDFPTVAHLRSRILVR